MLGAGDDLKIELAGQLAAEAQKPFIAILAHPAGAALERNIDEIARGIEHRERRHIVERVERRLARHLPVAAEHLPLIFATPDRLAERSEEHTSELQSLMRISYAVFCLNKKNIHHQ